MNVSVIHRISFYIQVLEDFLGEYSSSHVPSWRIHLPRKIIPNCDAISSNRVLGVGFYTQIIFHDTVFAYACAVHTIQKVYLFHVPVQLYYTIVYTTEIVFHFAI